jgi:xylulokinase
MYASLRGAGLFAAISLGKTSIDDVRALIDVEKTFEPDQRNRSRYESMYREFKKFYGALHGSYSRLNATQPVHQ